MTPPASRLIASLQASSFPFAGNTRFTSGGDALISASRDQRNQSNSVEEYRP